MSDADSKYTACSMPVERIVDLLNILDPLISKIKLISDLSPLADEAPIPDKGRVAVGLLELVGDYVDQLEAAVTLFSNRLPRCHGEDQL